VQVTAQLQNPHAAAYWAYSGLVLQRALGGRLPLWLTNGLAAVLSNTIVRNNEVEFGRPQPWMAERAKEGPRLPLPALFAVDHDSPSYRGGVDRERFDAQTWALVQFLIFGNKDNAAARFDQLIGQLAAGVPSEQAVTAVYGSVAALDEAYLLYVHQGVYSYSRLPTDTAIVEAQLPARVAAPADHMASRAAFHVAMNRPVEARALIAAARQADPASPAADTVEAVLLDREQHADEARNLFAKAAEAGSSSFWTYYRLAIGYVHEPPATSARRPGSRTGSGRRSRLLTIENSAVVAPIPRASVSTATTREAGPTRERPAPVPHVPAEILQPRHPLLVAVHLFDRTGRAEPQPCLATGFVARQTRAHEVVGRQFQVLRQFFSHTFILGPQQVRGSVRR